MTASSISQPMNNEQLTPQQGGQFVAQTQFDVNGGDALIGVSASAWSSQPGPISIEVWVDGQPTGQKLGLNASQGGMHLCLGHTWAYCQALSAGQHTLELLAGPTTVTDTNDYACATVWEMGTGCVVRFNYDKPSPTGTGELLIKDAFKTEGGTQVLMSASSSGWTATANQVMGSNIWYGAPTDTPGIYANNSNQDLAAVPADFLTTEPHRGQQLVQLQALANTSTNAADIAHLTVVEFVDPANAPVVRAQIQNATAQSQHGDGGTIASLPFQTGGGTLLFRVSASGWTSSANVPLEMGIQIDGNTLYPLRVFANPANTHMPLITNDLVIAGIAPSQNRRLGLIGQINTITDGNDRVSMLVMEFPS